MRVQHTQALTVRGRLLRGVALALGAIAVAGGFAALLAVLAIEVDRAVDGALLQAAPRGSVSTAKN